MELHEMLYSLRWTIGQEMFEDADGFRAAIDDYLDEGAASSGEIRLLVDAIRLGAYRRMISVIDSGSEPAAAVDAAAELLSRERGSADVVGSAWACAVLGYAAGKVQAADVERYRVHGPTGSVEPPTDVPPAAPLAGPTTTAPPGVFPPGPETYVPPAAGPPPAQTGASWDQVQPPPGYAPEDPASGSAPESPRAYAQPSGYPPTGLPNEQPPSGFPPWPPGGPRAGPPAPKSSLAVAAAVAVIVVGVATIVVLLATRGNDNDVASDPNPQATTSAGVEKLVVGKCRNLDQAALVEQADDTAPVDCASTHNSETFHVGQIDALDDLEYEQYNTATNTTSDLWAVDVHEAFSDICEPAFDSFVGGDDDLRRRSILSWAYYMPDETAWDSGDRTVRCDLIAIVYSVSGDGRLLELTSPGRGLLDSPEDAWMECLDSDYIQTPCSEPHAYRAVSTAVLGGDTDPWLVRATQRTSIDAQCGADLGDAPISRDLWGYGLRSVLCWRTTTQ